jgi:hypothetical protein
VSEGKRSLLWFSRKAALRRRGPGDAENEVVEERMKRMQRRMRRGPAAQGWRRTWREQRGGGEDEKDTEDKARPGSAGTETNLEMLPEVLEKAG